MTRLVVGGKRIDLTDTREYGQPTVTVALLEAEAKLPLGVGVVCLTRRERRSGVVPEGAIPRSE